MVRWQPGEAILRRDVWRGTPKVGWAGTVVADTDALLAIYIPEGGPRPSIWGRAGENASGLYTLFCVDLAKWQRNKIFKLLEQAELDPANCDLIVGGEDAESRLTHLPSESYLTLRQEWSESLVGHTYRGEAQVAGQTYNRSFVASEWRMIEGEIRRWASEVRTETAIPDLWAEVRRTRDAFSGTEAAEIANTPFTADEQAEIAAQFSSIRELVREKYSLTAEQMQSLETKLDELSKASERVGRKDWQLMARGAVLTLILEAVVPPDVARQVLVTVLQALGHLFGGPGVPALPGELSTGI